MCTELSGVGAEPQTGGGGMASFLEEAAPRPTGQGGRDVAPEETPSSASPDVAHSGTSHPPQPRGAGIIGEGVLCAACWSPSHSSRVCQATQQGMPARPTSPGLGDRPRAAGWRPQGLVSSSPPAMDTSLPCGLSVPSEHRGIRQAASTCSVRVRPQVASGDLEMEETQAHSQLGTQTWTGW